MKKNCEKCKEVFTLKHGSFKHILFDKEITIINVPFLLCETCGESSYVNEHTVDITLRDAFRDLKDQVEYKG